jgi:hypothetical protein
MKTKFKLFENVENMENYEVLATNTSYWGYNYDSNTRVAKILLDRRDNSLYLRIEQTKSKTGIGSGTWKNDLEFLKIGDLNKANLGIVRTLLKKHAHSKSTAGYGFSKFWQDEEGNKMTLGDLLDTLKPEKIEVDKIELPKKELKHIKSKKSFEENINEKDIELVSYSPLSHAIFGEGTRAIKDELVRLGCKYNKFLTDPKTGKKRPGWICSNKVLDKVKKLL